MNRHAVSNAIAFLVLASLTPPALSQHDEKKQAVGASIEKQKPELIDLSDRIWHFAEIALREKRSAAALADYAEKKGFRVERGVAGMPTAFQATFGQGRPIIGILGEYDALPGLSQKASPVREPLKEGGPGHGCGHNLFGPGSLGAAVAIKELIATGQLHGTIRFYGTPAEESVGGKIYMAREGLFDDLDVCLAWHPSAETLADMESTQALIDFIVEFYGQTAHAANDPWNGRSAADGLELFADGVNMLREHVKPSVRIHYAILNAGTVPNIVPAYAKIWCWVRDWDRGGVEEVFQRVRSIAKGAALMAGVESKLTIQSGDYEMLVNRTGARLLHRNLTRFGTIEYTDKEQEFARAIQRAAGVEEKGLDGHIHPLEGQPREGGSTDVGDVSWIVPTLHLRVTTAPVDVPWHAWPVVASGRTSFGHKGMIRAAKVLAATMVELFEDESLRDAIRAEFDKQTNGHVYKPYVPDGPPPLPAE